MMGYLADPLPPRPGYFSAFKIWFALTIAGLGLMEVISPSTDISDRLFVFVHGIQSPHYYTEHDSERHAAVQLCRTTRYRWCDDAIIAAAIKNDLF